MAEIHQLKCLQEGNGFVKRKREKERKRQYNQHVYLFGMQIVSEKCKKVGKNSNLCAVCSKCLSPFFNGFAYPFELKVAVALHLGLLRLESYLNS